MTNRRDLLLIGLGLAGVAGGWQLWVGREQPFAFSDIDHLPGWRRLETGQVTRPNGAALLTIGQGDDPIAALTPDELVGTLYRAGRAPSLAVFSDFFCPFCRSLTARLARRPDLPITWHELPLLGPASEIAAKAAVAADLQGQYAGFIEALARGGFRPSAAHMARVAETIGLDGQRLARDMDGEQVAHRLMMSRRAAATLGIFGTPGMTIDRTLVIGEVSMDALDRLMALEQS